MPRSADIISLAERARQSLAAEGEAGDEARLAHLALVSGQLPPAESPEAPPAPVRDIAFPLRSIPKWVPAGD